MDTIESENVDGGEFVNPSCQATDRNIRDLHEDVCSTPITLVRSRTYRVVTAVPDSSCASVPDDVGDAGHGTVLLWRGKRAVRA